MKYAVLAASIATLAQLASAAGYQATWTVKGDKCNGQIVLGEFKATPATCTPTNNCKAITTDLQGVASKMTCVENHRDAAKTALGANKQPYVLVEIYKENSNCVGAFDIAIAVAADGNCYTSPGGENSFNVTWSAEAGPVWRQYAEPKCTGDATTTIDFLVDGVDGEVCTYKFLKALAVPLPRPPTKRRRPDRRPHRPRPRPRQRPSQRHWSAPLS